MTDLTVLVQSCDKNRDLWPVFFEVFKRQWPDCPFRIVLNTETAEYTYDGLQVECLRLYKDWSEEALNALSWSQRFKDTLQHIKTKYTFVILDDFFIREPVNACGVECLLKKIDRIKRFGAVYFNYLNTPVFWDKRLKMNYIHHDTWTRVNSVSGIWLTAELDKTLVPGETPWTYEQNATQRYKRKKNTRFYCIPLGESPIALDFHEQLVQGKWSYECVELLKGMGIQVDFEARGVLPPRGDGASAETKKPRGFKEKVLLFSQRNYFLYDFLWHIRYAFKSVKHLFKRHGS